MAEAVKEFGVCQEARREVVLEFLRAQRCAPQCLGLLALACFTSYQHLSLLQARPTPCLTQRPSTERTRVVCTRGTRMSCMHQADARDRIVM